MSKNKIIDVYCKYRDNKKINKIIKKHCKNWVKLNSNELKNISNANKKTCIIFKNTFDKWNMCEYKYFVSEYIFQKEILPKLNSFNYDKLGFKNINNYFLDKNYQSMFTTNLLYPKTIYKCINGEFYNDNNEIITEKDCQELLEKYNEVVCKISLESGHGKGIQKYTKSEYDNIKKDFSKNYITQEIIKQSEFLKKFNSSSVNVIRITSLFWHSKIYILGAILRVGAPGAFCDHLSKGNNNPRIAAINMDGTLSNNVIDTENYSKYDNFWGVESKGKIPNFNKMILLVKKEHIKYPHNRLIGWDLTLNEKNEIICIEYNSLSPGIIQTQMVCGPIFAQKSDNNEALYDEILREKV